MRATSEPAFTCSLGLNSDSVCFVCSFRPYGGGGKQKSSADFWSKRSSIRKPVTPGQPAHGQGNGGRCEDDGKLFIGKRSQEALVFLRGFYLEVGGCPSKKKGFTFSLRLEGEPEKNCPSFFAMIKARFWPGAWPLDQYRPTIECEGGGKLSRFWFSEWKAKEDDEARPDLAFRSDPLCHAHLEPGYRPDRSNAPLGEKEAIRSVLMPRRIREVDEQAVAQIDPLSRTATFRVKEWAIQGRCLSCCV